MHRFDFYNPQRLNDFRHISLVGCMYKALANVLANRLKKVIGSVISNCFVVRGLHHASFID